MRINRLIESLIKDHDVNLETKEDGIKAFKEYDVFEKGKSGEYERYSLIDCLPRGTKFAVLIDEYSSYESGDCSWYFCIMIKYYDLYFSLHDRG